MSCRQVVEKPKRLPDSHPSTSPPFLSKLLGKTSKLQIFPSKLRRNAQKSILIINDLRGSKISRVQLLNTKISSPPNYSAFYFNSLSPNRQKKKRVCILALCPLCPRSPISLSHVHKKRVNFSYHKYYQSTRLNFLS